MGKGQKAAPGACKCPRVYTIMDRIPVLWEGRRPDMQKTEMKHLFSAAADYMDAAMPISRGGESYVVYILDNRETVRSRPGR